MFSALSATVQKTIASQYTIDEAEVYWEVPVQSEHGDIATPIALQIAKKVGESPRVIADTIVASLADHPDIETVEVAGPGYINIFLTPQALLQELDVSLQKSAPLPTREDEQPIIVEYSSPNIAKPFGIHHILTTVIGQVITNLHRYQGYNTIAINHVGDWGTQFGKLLIAHEQYGQKPLEDCSIDDLLALYVKFHDEAENDTTLEERGRAAFKQLEGGDPTVRSFWQTVVDITMTELEKTFEQLDVSFDFVQGESFYEEKMQAVIDEGIKKGVFIEGENGALIAVFPEESHLPPAVIVKGDGATIYMTRDLATVRYRLDTWNPTKILHVVGAEQQLYFQQLIAIVDQLGWKNPLEHVAFGRMKFAEGDMSTRRGKVLKLQDVLDEAVERAQKVIASHGDKIQTDSPEELAKIMGRGAVVYGVLSQNRKMNFTFDWDTSLSFEGNSAPYLQYTHARAQSILRKAEFDSSSLPICDQLTPKERALLSTLIRWPHVITQARESYMPHLICTYLFTLCQVFNSFYSVEPILEAQDTQRVLRLTLTHTTAHILKTGASLLTISVPDRM